MRSKKKEVNSGQLIAQAHRRSTGFVTLYSCSSLKDGVELKDRESLFSFYQSLSNVKCKKFPHPSFVGHGKQK